MQITHRLVATAGAAALILTAGAGFAVAQRSFTPSVKPMQAISLDVGSKQVGGYYLSENGQCRVTLMISDAYREDGVAPTVTRLQLTVESGKPALIDTAGKVLKLDCQNGAQALNAALSDQIAYRSATK